MHVRSGQTETERLHTYIQKGIKMTELHQSGSSSAPGRRILYLDYLRVLATLAVILLHISAQNWREVGVNTYQWQIFNFCDSISRWCVAVFVMISGALFLSRRCSIRSIYSHNILRLVTAALFWGVIYALILGGTPGQILLYTIRGRYHMWFIPMIIGIYICIPIIEKITESSSVTGYFLILTLVFAFLLPQFTNLAEDFGGSFLNEIVSAINENIEDMDLHLVLGYTGYFILGFCLSKIDFSRKQRRLLYLAGAAGFVFTAGISACVSLKTQVSRGTYYDDFTFNVLLESVAVFLLLKYHCPQWEIFKKIILILSKYSFGAYLAHVLILEQLKRMGLTTLTFTPLLSVPLIFFITAVFSFGISAVIHQVPVLKKYVV